MVYKRFTTTAAANVWPNRAKRAIIQVNGALTGTITVSDESGTAGTPVVAIITNPTVGSIYEYWGFNTGVTITPSAICDITCSVDTSNG